MRANLNDALAHPMLDDETSLDNDPFADAVDARIDGVLHTLDPAHVPASRLVGAVTATVFLVVGAIGVAIVWFVTDLSGGAKVAVTVAILGLVVFVFALGYLWPPLELARTSWRVDVDGIVIKRGVVFRHVISIPGTRIQHLDVSQGPVQRRFGLGTLVVHTAGTHDSEVNLEGIAREKALRVRDFLLEHGPNRASGRVRGEHPSDGA